ncbi:putative bifunctional diguanylate cyclase/phosphodiesterase [Vibrio sinaloensis]|uniref:putative bifunctional diguanylate cyclase/phosphodiesterase n=2 Tax=Photobacterium sp. (strain ATCC 43367) TaxID=379097 RepID=UPI002F41BAD7
MRQNQLTDGLQVLGYLAYLSAVGWVTYTLTMIPHSWNYVYYLFPLMMMIALFVKEASLKHLFAFSSLALFVVGGLIDPFNLDDIQLCLILLPLCYIVLFPGTLWPIAVGAALINSYLYQLSVSDFDAFVDFSIQLTAITLFSTLLVYFYVQTRKQAEQFHRDSVTDYLTKLPNANAYNESLQRVDKSNLGRFGLIHIGMEGFKNVNDRLGYRHGDALLIAFAHHLKDLVESKGEIFRFGGDEFVILVESKHIEETLQELVDELLKHHKMMFSIENTSHRITYCIGVAYATDAKGNMELWAKNADFALYKARTEGAGSVCWFDNELLSETIRQHQIETEIKDALANNQFVLQYQPKVSIKESRIVGAEALIRWLHPELGPISPAEFIPVAEKTTQIVPLGQWIIYQACAQAKQLNDQGLDVCIAINVSTVQFAHADLFDVLCKALKQTKLPSHLLQVEITESTLMSDPEHITDICRQLRAIGVTIAIDDFGVEYSCLKYLKQLPIDVLKIDKCFVDECSVSHSDRVLVNTIVQMGHSLGIKVIAEGVEHEEQLAVLEELGCDQYQGYLFSQPLSYQEFSSMILQERIEASSA